MNSQAKSLWNFWNEIRNKATIKFSDIDKLEKLLGNLF